MNLALLTLSMTLAYVPGIPSAAHAGRWVVLALGAAILVWGVRVRPTVAHWMGLLLLVWMALGVSWAFSPADALGDLWRWTAAAVLFCVAAETTDLTPALKALVIGVSVSAPFSISQALGYPLVLTLGDANLATGLWLSKNCMAEVAAVALIVAASLRLWWGLPGPLVCLALVGGREGVLMMAAAIGTLVWGRINWTQRIVGLTACSILVALAATRSAPGQWGFINDRLEIWAWTADHLSLTGWGLGSFASARPDYEFSHNELLQYAFELGLGVLPLIGVVWYALASNRGGPEEAALAALLAAAAVWFPLHAPATVLLFAVLAGYLCGRRGRAVRTQSQGRAARQPGAEPDLSGLGIGALVPADTRRWDLAPGPQHQNRAAHVRSPVGSAT